VTTKKPSEAKRPVEAANTPAPDDDATDDAPAVEPEKEPKKEPEKEPEKKPKKEPKKEPEPEPRISLAEFEAVAPVDNVTFAGFRATVCVREGVPKDRSGTEWVRTLNKWRGV